MWSGRSCAATVLAGVVGLGGMSAPTTAGELVLRAEVAAPLKLALTILDDMCMHGAREACAGANVLRGRQAVLMITNAQCARGNADACLGLVSAGYELEALAGAVARQAAAAALGQKSRLRARAVLE